jgi:type I restriction enzyme, S subunit
VSAALAEALTTTSTVPLADAVEFNPKPARGSLADDFEVSFLPMAAVEAGSGRMDPTQVRAYIGVKKGFTSFRDGDVLFAKITPCMENGKMAVAHGLHNGIGFGSTEFHVLRPRHGVDAQYVYHFVSSASFRREAAHHMTGAVGQKRVPLTFLQQSELPLPDIAEQRRIVAEIEKQFSRLDGAVANLQRVKANLKRYRNAVLAAALSGEFDNLPTGLMDAAGNDAGHHGETPEMAPDTLLPPTWSWVRADEICAVVASGSTPKPDDMSAGAGDVPFIKVYNLTFGGALDFTVKPTFIAAATHNGLLARSRCRPGDVLMNIVGPPLGKISIIPTDFPEWNINQAVVTFRANERVLNRLLAYWLMSPPVRKRIERTSKATAGQFNVQVSTCRRLMLPLPPLAEQHRIVAEIDRRLSIVREVEAEVDANLKRAQALQQTILAKAFSSGI